MADSGIGCLRVEVGDVVCEGHGLDVKCYYPVQERKRGIGICGTGEFVVSKWWSKQMY